MDKPSTNQLRLFRHRRNPSLSLSLPLSSTKGGEYSSPSYRFKLHTESQTKKKCSNTVIPFKITRLPSGGFFFEGYFRLTLLQWDRTETAYFLQCSFFYAIVVEWMDFHFSKIGGANREGNPNLVWCGCEPWSGLLSLCLIWEIY